MPSDRDSDPEIQRLKRHIEALETERDKLKKRDRDFLNVFDRVADSVAVERPVPVGQTSSFSGVSFVIVYHDIPRQIERTLLSCAPDYQGATPEEIEVILVDNGSSTPPPPDLQDRFPYVSQILQVEDTPSPVAALNVGLAAARHDMIALMIDGAHLLSPGVVNNARDIWGLFPGPVINVPQYILGRESQNLTTQSDAFDVEAKALKDLNWPEEGYCLFDYAVYPGENYDRSYVEAIESNCLITTRDVLDRYGGFDPRYDEPGGGFANLEIFSRLIHQPDNSYITLAGEGTFHQDHRGVTTQRAPEERNALVAAYRRKHLEVTGSEGIVNARSTFLYGKVRKHTQRIPTISRDFGRASHKLQRSLAEIYVDRVRAGVSDALDLQLTTGPIPDERKPRRPLRPLGLLPEAARRNGTDKHALSYLTCLKQVHKTVQPELYFEIGIDTGESLALARCPSVGVDPDYMLSSAMHAPTRVFRRTSDAFFADAATCERVFANGIDLAFIDGMHLAENVLRDFIETEKWMRPDGVIMFDDVLPEQMEMLGRERHFNAWCGDVFKIVPILRRYRPDLRVSVFETFIGPYRKGLAIVSGLDPKNSNLSDKYDEIAGQIHDGVFDVQSIAELETVLAPLPVTQLAKTLSRSHARDLAAARPVPTSYEIAAGPDVPDAPLVSVVVASYNMPRALPRTLLSLSERVQTGMRAAEYEIIVVDNGSTEPADMDRCLSTAPNTRFLSLPPGQVSPCYAVNTGIAAARADCIGVLIDGARMASPGLLSQSLRALDQDRNTVVGSFGYHIGEVEQSLALAQGYDEQAEDALLAGANWQEDGYRLFDISVLSKSSGKGTDVLPSESNALFMHRDFWNALNGYDARFASPGGGLANLDLWKRACERPGTRVRMLVGEGTFHQIHGGVSTNAKISPRAAFDAEYRAIRGVDYVRPKREFEHFSAARSPVAG